MKRFLILLYALLLINVSPFSIEAATDQSPSIALNNNGRKQTVCVNMIVKNESKVITRCLASVKPFIDYWVIVDTGSTDNTQSIIKEFMKDVPGELYESTWVNFEHNRNEALQKAKGKSDYILIIDADEILAFADDFKKPYFDKDFYNIITKYGGTEYARVQLINNHIDWQWKGVVHEALDSPFAKTSGTLTGVNNIVHTDGARSNDPFKYRNDAIMIADALEKDPTNTRYMFYLAQSWRDAGEFQKSLDYYQKRVEMGGWNEEVYWSMLQIAHLQKILDAPSEKFLKSYYEAFHYRNTRPEAIYQIVNYYRMKGDYAQGYLMGQIGNSLPVSQDILFLEKWIYDYGMELELSICAYWIGKYDESLALSQKLLNKPNLPLNVKQTVEANSNFARQKLLEQNSRNLYPI